MDLPNDGSSLNLDKHRFLLMSKTIDNTEYASLVDLAPSQRADEVSSCFASKPGCLFFRFGISLLGYGTLAKTTLQTRN
jgi:hypothetical protein